MNTNKVNRNDPCPCGSGKKYKQCCQATLSSQQNIPNGRLLDDIPNLFKKAVNYQQLNQLDKAEALYLQILTLSPKQVDTLTKLAFLYQKTDRIDLAISLFRKIARIEPTSKNYTNLGQALMGEEGIEFTRKAVELNPGDVAAHNNLGGLLLNSRRYKEAITCFEKVLHLNSQHEQALSNIGLCLMAQSQYQQAAHYFRQSIAINPFAELSYMRLLFCLCFDTEAFPDIYLKEAQRLNAIWKTRAKPYHQWLCPQLASNQPMRIGLVSGDLGNHPVGYFLESFIQQTDKSKIEFFVYSTRAKVLEDDLSERIQEHVQQWSIIRALTDQQAAEKIHTDGIHILIDLAGYTTNSGISIFNWRPAPIQMSWLGYFASTGLECFDYFLADPIAVPNKNQFHFSEKVCYLPHTRLCFSPPNHNISQELSELPALKNGFVTFGCFQHLSKVNDKILIQWAKILDKCPNSQLVIKNNQLSDPLVKAELLLRLKSFGIPKESIILEQGSPRAQYLEAYHHVDFMLDTFPYTGGTTTCEALWMGIPTLTLAGNTLLERQGMVFMSCVGLHDWIADNEDDYVQKAVNHALNLENLSHTRNTLRETMKKSPLVDAARFAKDIEVVFANICKEKTFD